MVQHSFTHIRQCYKAPKVSAYWKAIAHFYLCKHKFMAVQLLQSVVGWVAVKLHLLKVDSRIRCCCTESY